MRSFPDRYVSEVDGETETNVFERRASRTVYKFKRAGEAGGF